MTKTTFLKALSDKVIQSIYLTDTTEELKNEIEFNYCELTIPNELVAEISETDLLEFIHIVKKNYQNQLYKSNLKIDLIFYLWFDEMAGQIRFNFINSNHKELPFNCHVELIHSAEEIVEMFLKKDCSGIPWVQLNTISPSEDLKEAYRNERPVRDDFVLKVYQEIIKKTD